jgi:adenosylmethionine---8-amino-7-oxononanoate aminotransferase
MAQSSSDLASTRTPVSIWIPARPSSPASPARPRRVGTLGCPGTGGYLPLAATLATDEIYRAFLGHYDDWKHFLHGHSYTGNPLACAVALANLSVFRAERTLSRMERGIRLLRHMLEPLADFKHIGDVRQCGYMVGIELVQDKSTRAPYPLEARMGHRVAMEVRRRGIILRPLGHVVVLMPPLSISPRELGRMVTIVGEAIQTVTEQGPGG